MQTWKLKLEYEGTRYSGWQEQANARTVQGELRRAASDLFNRDLDIGGSGRTDAGVHALGQIAHVKIRRRPGDGKLAPRPIEILHGLNDRLPADINVLSVEEADPRFHARHSATSRTYRYQISTRRTALPNVLCGGSRTISTGKPWIRTLALFRGRHDFAAFSERDPGRDHSSIVVVDSVALSNEEHLIVFRVTASHFLWKMVRRLVGSMVEVGRGRVSVEDVRTLIKDPRAKSKLYPARVTAPPSGLFLEQITYGSANRD
jgi:tRNA pseudouridine38-40 synthase